MTSSSSPTRRTSSTPRPPGPLIARSAFFGQHGYVPDVQDRRANVNMRATFLAGGPAIQKGRISRVRSIDIAPTIAYLLDVPLPQHRRARSCSTS